MISHLNFILNKTLIDLECLAQENHVVLWINDCNYQQALFISNTYHDIWKRSCVSLYQDWASWQTYLAPEHQDALYQLLRHRNTMINPDHTHAYCFYLPDGGKQWCIDRCMRLYDSNNVHLLNPGVALPVLEHQLIGEEYEKASHFIDNIILKYYHLIARGVDFHQKDSEFFKCVKKLSAREKEILDLILCGLTAKQIARKLDISPRTIETHLNNIKTKFNCGSKSELISNAIASNYIRIA